MWTGVVRVFVSDKMQDDLGMYGSVAVQEAEGE